MKNFYKSLMLIFLILLSIQVRGQDIVGSTTHNICYDSSSSVLLEAKLLFFKGVPNRLKYWQISDDGSTWTTYLYSTNIYVKNLTQNKYFRYKYVKNNFEGYLYISDDIVTFNVAQELTNGSIGENQTIFYGQTPTIINSTSLATGGMGNITYQWESSLNETTWTPISNATSISYQSGPLQNTTYFRRRSDNSCGSLYTNKVSVTVLISISGGSIGNEQFICHNTRPDLIEQINSASGGTGSYSYQWESSLNGTTWTAINGATSKNYQPGILTTNIFYRRKTTENTNATFYSYSNNVKITILPTLNTGSISSNQTICRETVPAWLNGTVAFGGSGPYTYQWESSLNGSTWTAINGATSLNYLPEALTTTTHYRRRVTDFQCGNNVTLPITITVRADLNAGTIGTSQTTCYGTTPLQLTGTIPSGGAGSYTYQWESSLNEFTWTDINGATSQNYQPEALNTTTHYRRRVTDTQCGNNVTLPVTITVRADFDAGTIGSSQSIFYNTSPSKIIGESPTGGNITPTYQWQISYDKKIWQNVNEAISKDYQPKILTKSTFFKRLTTNECGIKESNIVEINVYSSLNPGTISSSQTICYNTAPVRLVSTLPNGGDGSYTYQWKMSLDNLTWDNVTGATTATFQPEALKQTISYKREVASGSNKEESNAIQITVLPNLSENIITSSQTICFDTYPQILAGSSMTGGDDNFTYKWQKSTNGVNWSDVSNGTNISYQPEALKQTTHYKRIVQTQCKTSESNKILIAVIPEFNPGSIGNNQTIIFGNVPQIISPNIPVSGGSGNYTYQWKKSTNGTNWVSIMGATSNSYQPEILTQTTSYYRQTFDSQCGNEQTNTIKITVTTENELIGSISENQTICYNTSPAILTSSGMNESEVIYQQWQKSIDGKQWEDIPGETTKTYTPPLLTATTYYRKKTITASNGEAESNIVIINVKDEFNKGTISDNQSICTNNKPKPITTIIPPNHEVINRWESSANGTTWNILTNEKQDYLELPIITKTTIYRKVVTSVCGELATSPVLITVSPILTGGNIQESQTIDYNIVPNQVKGNLPTGGNGSYTYYWEKSYYGLDWNQIPNETEVNLQLPALQQTTHIRRVASSGDCSIAFSNPIIITVTTKLGAGYIGNNQTICYGAVPEKILGTEASGGIGIFTYIWERSTDGEKWEVLFGKTDKDFIPVAKVTKTTYYRRKTISGTTTSISNIVRIDHLPEVITPQITYTDRYCKGANISINSNIDKVSWYDENMNFASNKSILTATANESTKYYYQIENTIGCKGDLKPVNLTVDFINADIQTNAINSKSVENGERLTITPNISSNFTADKIKYTWTFNHQQQGWYETMFDESPSQYFHWKGAYDITLVTKTPTGCEFTSESLSAFYVNEETEDTRVKSAHTGSKKYLDSNFGLNKEVSINVYPSLFDAVLNVELNNMDSKANLYLHDVAGRIVLTRSIDEGSNLISTDALAKGIYIVRVTSKKDTTVFNAKVIKH